MNRKDKNAKDLPYEPIHDDVERYLKEVGVLFINPVLNKPNGDKVVGHYYKFSSLFTVKEIIDDLIVLFRMNKLNYSLSDREKDSTSDNFIIYFNNDK